MSLFPRDLEPALTPRWIIYGRLVDPYHEFFVQRAEFSRSDVQELGARKPLKTKDLINIAWIYHRNYYCYHLVGPINLNIFVIMLMMVWKKFISFQLQGCLVSIFGVKNCEGKNMQDW